MPDFAPKPEKSESSKSTADGKENSNPAEGSALTQRQRQILALQHTIGNRAVQRMLSGISQASINPIGAINPTNQIQRVVLKLPKSDNPEEMWEVDTRGQDRENIKSWIDEQVAKGNTTALGLFIQQMEGVTARDDFENEMLTYARRDTAPSSDVSEHIGNLMAIMETEQNEVEVDTPKTFAERAKSIAPQWIQVKPHGDVPKNGHVFVYRFTDATRLEWQMSHLGKTARDKSVKLAEKKPNSIGKTNLTSADRKVITEKAKIWDALKLTQDIRAKAGSIVAEAQKLTETLAGDIPVLREEVAQLGESLTAWKQQYQVLLGQYNTQYPNQAITATDATSVQKQIQDYLSGAQPAQRQMLNQLHDLSGKVHFSDTDFDNKRNLLRYYEGMPSEPEAIKRYIARHKALELALHHFSGAKAKLTVSPFVSTAADYVATATHPDKVTQSIVRSDANLEQTDDYDPSTEHRALGYDRARHLVMYEIPLELLVSPEDVEAAFGMGSSDTEGLVAMRKVKERLYLGDDLPTHMVAYAENPF